MVCCKCGKKARYGFAVDKIKAACTKCKTDGMIDLYTSDVSCFSEDELAIIAKKGPRICINGDCKKQASYGYPESTKRILCAEHKTDKVVSCLPKCRELGCKLHPSYANKGDKTALYCLAHKKEDHVDIRSKYCEADNCDKYASYGDAGTRKAIYCVEHKKDIHINVTAKRVLLQDVWYNHYLVVLRI
jgi:EsV-1-7 cysteine-rich motif